MLTFVQKNKKNRKNHNKYFITINGNKKILVKIACFFLKK